jgi:hypothetical protein
MNKPLLYLAKHNYAALADLAIFLSRQGSSASRAQAMHDVALLVRDLFEEMAWSDRHTSYHEYDLLDGLIQEDEAIEGNLIEVLSQPLQSIESNGIPPCLASAANFDRQHGTAFTDMMIRHIENLGYLILVSDSLLTQEEKDHYEAYIGQLRTSVTLMEPVLKTATA